MTINKTEKLLKTVCLSLKSDQASIISVNNNKFTVLFHFGITKEKDKDILSINSFIIKNKDLPFAKLIAKKEIKNFFDETGYKSFFIDQYTDEAGHEYFCVLFSKLKTTYYKTSPKDFKTLWKSLKESTNADVGKINLTDRDIVMNTDAPVLISTHGFDNIKFNRSLALIFNADKEKLTKDFFSKAEFYDSQNKLLSFSELPFVVAARENINVTDFKLRYVDGEHNEKWFKVSSFQTKLNDSHIVLSFFCDITSQIELDQNLKETFSSIQSVLYSTNIKGDGYNFISDAVINLFGYSPEEIYKKKFKILRSIHSADLASFKDFLKIVQSGEASSIEYRMIDRFGKIHWVRHSGVPIFKNNKVVKIVGEIQEITDEKNIQLNLARSEERFRALVDTAEDLIFLLDGFGYLSTINKNGANALGYSPEEMIGKHFLEFISKEEGSKIAEAFAQILNSSGVTTFETVFLDKFEKEITFEINAKPMITDGEISGMLSIARNISSRKADEQKIKDLNTKLIEANRIISIERERARNKITVLEELNKLKSEFISNVSHELRTPLASIVGFAETIVSDKDLPEDTLHEFVEIILTEGKRLAKLINDLLDFSKLDSGEEELNRERVNLVDVLLLVLQTFQKTIQEKQLIVTQELPENDVILNVDKERMAKVFSNILANAVKFTATGGRINLIVQDFGKEVEIAISDTGVGISEKELPHLFQKFSKVQKPGQPIGGAGFGLVTVKQIIDLHKGYIRVKSEVNKGTTFIIRLPK